MNTPGGKRKSVSPVAAAETLQLPSKRGRASGRDVQHTCQNSPVVSPSSTEHPGKNFTDQFNHAQRRKFASKLVDDLIVVEICAGSARLTKVAREAGFNGIAIDHTDKRSCGIDICIFELEDETQVNDLCNFIEQQADNIAAIWVAPSCGTASKARERRVPQLRKLGIKEPIPLRSIELPDQIDGLQGTDKIKVEKANLLYDAIKQIVQTACKAHIFIGVENPANSHYWHTSPMRDIMDEFGEKFVTFHNCCHGGSRDNTLLFNGLGIFDYISRAC